MELKTLTTTRAVALGKLISACQANKRVRWLNESGNILDGVARYIGDQWGNLLYNQDCREGFVRISSTFEHFLPVEQVIDMIIETTFQVD